MVSRPSIATIPFGSQWKTHTLQREISTHSRRKNYTMPHSFYGTLLRSFIRRVLRVQIAILALLVEDMFHVHADVLISFDAFTSSATDTSAPIASIRNRGEKQ